jgi:hypothetical protein
MSGLLAPVAGLEVLRDDSVEGVNWTSLDLEISTVLECLSLFFFFVMTRDAFLFLCFTVYQRVLGFGCNWEGALELIGSMQPWNL